MFSDRIFKYSVILSVLTHSVIFAPWPVFKLPALLVYKDNLEVSYLELRQFDEVMKLEKDTKTKETTIEISKKSEQPIRQELAKIETIKEKDIAQLKIEKTEKKEDAAPPKSITTSQSNEMLTYLDYYQALREKIKYFAHKNYPKYNIEGEVFISFTISSDGTIADIKILDEKSDDVAVLKSAALRSLRDASPFPPFPKEISQPQIKFNLPILFKLSKSSP